MPNQLLCNWLCESYSFLAEVFYFTFSFFSFKLHSALLAIQYTYGLFTFVASRHAFCVPSSLRLSPR
ncbi:hypothetical protein PILCRDRAFT_726337 [Piloderma croceum F 1598]|uniref:Uncharacterized protein n=1 Tax=Piloderma croceum (strain F 1598) TaxID=765440 RepID=A0A0C3F000_PILCF|nr:hypothetical protein PILCRDRAFT_726337 [Piloderma croceum F 1598]